MQRTGLDYVVLVVGIIGAIMVLGTVLLAFVGKEIPSVIITGDLAVIGFFFTNGIATKITSVIQQPRPQDTQEPQEKKM